MPIFDILRIATLYTFDTSVPYFPDEYSLCTIQTKQLEEYQ